MKKTELLSIVLVIFGLNTFVFGIVNLSEQFSYLVSIPEANRDSFGILVAGGYLLATAVIFLLAYLLVFRSAFLSGKIIKEDQDIDIRILISKADALHIALVIITLVVIIGKLPWFISAAGLIIQSFIFDFTEFRTSLPQHIGMILLYLSCFIILVNAKPFSRWILSQSEKKTDKNT